MFPAPGIEQPSLTPFAEAQDRKRTLLGSPVTFLWPAVVTFPPWASLSPETGKPFDPTVQPVSSAQASATLTASVFFKAINRGGAANSEISSQIGHDERSRLFVNLAYSDGAVVKGQAATLNGSAVAGFGTQAAWFIFHNNLFKIYSIKDDEIVLGYRRTLVYGAGVGAVGLRRCRRRQRCSQRQRRAAQAQEEKEEEKA